MYGIYWIALTLVIFFACALKPVNANHYLRTLLTALVFTMLVCYMDKDTTSPEQVFSPGYLFVSALYAINIAGLISLTRFMKVKAPWGYGIMLLASLSLQCWLLWRGIRDFETGRFIFDTVFFFAYLSAVYFVSGFINKYISHRGDMQLKTA